MPHLVMRLTSLVLHSDAAISLPEILSCLSATSLASHVVYLRRMLTTNFIERVLSQPTSISQSVSPDATVHTLALFPAPPNAEELPARLESLATTFNFLSDRLLSAFPEPNGTTFRQSLTKPLTTALLHKLLIPAMPSSLAALPPFLDLARRSREFEAEYVARVLKDTSDGEVTRWVDSVGSHYERKRRVDLLDRARAIITATGHDTTFRAEIVTFTPAVKTDVIPVQSEMDVQPEEEDAWGFDEAPRVPVVAATKLDPDTTAEDDSWNLDSEDMSEEPLPEATPGSDSVPSNGANGHSKSGVDEHEASDDAWGLDDDGDESAESAPEPQLVVQPSSNGDSLSPEASDDATAVEDPWDDPWEDPPTETKPAPPPPKPVAQPIPVHASSHKPAAPPKRATRLEKLAMKGKGGSNASSPAPSPIPLFSPSPSPSPAPSPAPSSVTDMRSPPISRHPPPHPNPVHRPQNIVVSQPSKETYLVSTRSKDIVRLFHSVLDEGKALAASNVFSSPSSSTVPGMMLLQSAPAVLDLFRALYPVKFEGDMRKAPGKAMRFSNDCIWLGSEVVKVEAEDRKLDGATRERVKECKSRLDALSDWWFEETIVCSLFHCPYMK
jgi:protein transport protein DSL1/ZW10